MKGKQANQLVSEQAAFNNEKSVHTQSNIENGMRFIRLVQKMKQIFICMTRVGRFGDDDNNEHDNVGRTTNGRTEIMK